MIDIKNLEIGKVYLSFHEGKISPAMLCFVKIKEKTANGYLVDVEWYNEIIATNQLMVYRKNFLTTVDDYGGTITPNIYNTVKAFWISGYIENEELGATVLKNS